MALPKNIVIEGAYERPQQAGEVIPTCDIFPTADTTVTTYNYTADRFVKTLQNRSPATASADNIPDAAALIASVGPQMPGTAWRHRIVNAGAGIITLTAPANTGGTVVSPTVNATSFKDFLVTILNGTPQQTISGLNSTNGNAVITGLTQAQLDSLSVGMTVQNAVAGQQGRTIIGMTPANGSTPTGTVTLSGNSTSTATGLTFTFYPSYTVQGIGQGTL